MNTLRAKKIKFMNKLFDAEQNHDIKKVKELLDNPAIKELIYLLEEAENKED